MFQAVRLISNLTGWPDKMSKRGKDWIQKESWHVDLFKSEKVETKSQSVPFQQISKTSGLKFSFLGETNAAGVNRISFLFSVLLTTNPSAGQVTNTDHFHTELQSTKTNTLIISSLTVKEKWNSKMETFIAAIGSKVNYTDAVLRK